MGLGFHVWRFHQKWDLQLVGCILLLGKDVWRTSIERWISLVLENHRHSSHSAVLVDPS